MAGEKMPRFAALMARLRSSDGCPWDRDQNHETLKIHLVEETYEVIEAIESGNPDSIREELGDLLLQIVFHAQIACEAGQFTIDDVIEGIHNKLIRRHPHVFADVKVSGSRDVVKNWETIKARERDSGDATQARHQESILQGTPKHLPPLAEACQLTSRASRVGFDWETTREILEKLDEEITELRKSLQGGNRPGILEEIGDLLFVMANLARHLHVDPEVALKRANRKFISRFHFIEEQLRKRGRTLQEATLEEMNLFWDEAKGDDHC